MIPLQAVLAGKTTSPSLPEANTLLSLAQVERPAPQLSMDQNPEVTVILSPERRLQVLEARPVLGGSFSRLGKAGWGGMPQTRQMAQPGG
jgi:hypothetical protein